LALFLIKFFVTRRANTASDQLKFFERVWENFCSQKFSQLPPFFGTGSIYSLISYRDFQKKI